MKNPKLKSKPKTTGKPKTKRRVAVQRLVSLLGKTRSIYPVLYPESEDRMPYLLINAENRRVLQQIHTHLNRLRKQANDIAQGRRANKA